MPECGNSKCPDNDAEYPGSCSFHYRDNNSRCPKFEKRKPFDMDRFRETAEIARKHLDNYENMGKNGEIVRRFKALLAERQPPYFIVKELEKML